MRFSMLSGDASNTGGVCVIPVLFEARNLGANLHVALSMCAHITTLCRFTMFHVRRIDPIMNRLTTCANEHYSEEQTSAS